MEFHISRAVREKYNVDDLLFTYSGNVVFGNIAASRTLAKQINDVRDTSSDPTPIHAGALFAMGLVDELSHAMVARYRAEVDPDVLRGALEWILANGDPAEVERLLLQFTEEFPNVAVYRGTETASEWLAGATEAMPNREAAIEELLLLWLANVNPAFVPFRELFDDQQLKSETVYRDVIAEFGNFIETRPPFSPEAGTLLDILRAPMLASPDSLMGQLAFIREHWSEHLGTDLRKLLLATDVLNEEEIAIWMQFHPNAARSGRGRATAQGEWSSEGFEGDEFVGFGPGGRAQGAQGERPLNEYEAFSQDQDWMPTVVMVAKSTYVWLEQLSQKYGTHIHRLDQIPDEELALLAARGLNALWLIGLWERSVASQTIKRLRGQHDAVASAYSLKDYRIAEDLGGWEAYQTLRSRAAAAGIRLASDMVPNHMGIDSTWVMEHPEWFLSRPQSPFPVYTYEGPDLSTGSRFEIKIEDHYFEQTDAAVTFRLRDRSSGWTRFVYHGNDGTTFAWNDTAQLDYSKAAVREQVIQTILEVARLFPIIRFDAAMTLAKKHVQRLWFPLPGAGGSIPSRAEDAMSQEEFDALMPAEFWREVVDRVAVEVPGTLLLAEAFWLLEGYFVRTLGMHRVYNSAFMNMLRDEENAKYRSYLKKTIEFDPDILKRYVNFMSNPDERTAIDQFGTGDKYFGVCTLLATLPGLPMFGHGQIEAYTEKYGMEYKQARFKECPNDDLVARHGREIAPLLKNRRLFAESRDFVLYDFWTGDGRVDENVFAYSNRHDDDRVLVLYNNAYGSTRGTIHTSAASMDKASGVLRQRSLVDALQLPRSGDIFVAYKDTASGLEYLRRSLNLDQQGFSMDLRGYQYVVLQHWRELRASAEQPWDQLSDALAGVGVYNLDEALSKLRLRPLHDALRQALSTDVIHGLIQASTEDQTALSEHTAKRPPKAGKAASAKKASAIVAVLETHKHPQLDSFLTRSEAFLAIAAGLQAGVNRAPAIPGETSPAVASHPQPLERDLSAMLHLTRLRHASTALPEAARDVIPGLAPAEQSVTVWATVLAALLLRHLAPSPAAAAALFDDLQLRSAVAEIFSGLGLHNEDTWRAAARVRVLVSHEAPLGLIDGAANPSRSPDFWQDGDVRWLASVSEAFGSTYFNKEGFEDLLCLLEVPSLLGAVQRGVAPSQIFRKAAERLASTSAAANAAGYNLAQYLAAPVIGSPAKKTSRAPREAKISIAAASKPSAKSNAARSVPSITADKPAPSVETAKSAEPPRSKPAKPPAPAKQKAPGKPPK